MILGQSNNLALEDPQYFYNDTVKLQFSRRDHVYYQVNADESLDKVDGVTNTCGVIDKSQFLMPWACKVMAARIIECMPENKRITGRVAAMTLKSFELLVQTAKKAHKEHKEGAADLGTQAHNWLEDTIRDAILRNDGVVVCAAVPQFDDERVTNCVASALRWMERHYVVWLGTEQQVYSRAHRYAGTMDGLARVSSCDDPKCCPNIFRNQTSLIDWKSSNALRTEYLYQTAAYQQAYTEEFLIDIDARWILRLGKAAGDFESWYETDFEQDFVGFLACLNLVRRHREVEKRLREKRG